jgi:hypothetical protein
MWRIRKRESETEKERKERTALTAKTRSKIPA